MKDQVVEKDEMREIINEFIVEAGELTEKAIQDVVKIENNPDKGEIINDMFRAVHTIKGTSSFLGFNGLSALAHKAEDILGLARKGNKVPNHAANALLEALDLIKILLEEIKESGAEQSDTAPTIKKLEALKSPEKQMSGETLPEAIAAPSRAAQDLSKAPEKAQTGMAVEEVSAGEEAATETATSLPAKHKKEAHKEESTIRIEVKKLDELMNLAGELVLGKNRLILLNNLVKKSDAMGSAFDNLADITNYIEVVANELQLSVMRARLVPISKLFNKAPRLARDLSADFKKEIALTMEGEETELDRSLIEGLYDPLVHIIRNSVDHGVETPEERERKGKPRKGVLSLKAYNEGNNVMIEFFDDGKGIDVDAVKKKALEKAILAESEIASLSSRDVMNLVFAAGLSTAGRVTGVSGRGVGMDVVKTNVEKMNGQVFIDSEEGKWTKLTLRLPLTLAIMKALIVRILDDLYAIPLNTVTELVKLEKDLIKSIDKKEVLVLRDKVIPVVDLGKLFTRTPAGGEDKYVVICTIEERTVGIKVRGVEGQEEVVIKPLGEFLGNIKGIGGATIRGDGKAILILDMSAMIGYASFQELYRKIA
jgi:two-component system chemotaxis sensor kinase CheA